MAELQDAIDEFNSFVKDTKHDPDGTTGGSYMDRAKATALLSIAKSLEIIAAKP